MYIVLYETVTPFVSRGLPHKAPNHYFPQITHMVRLQLPRQAQTSVEGVSTSKKKNNKKRARHDDEEEEGGEGGEAGEEDDDGVSDDTEGDTEAARIYQGWLEARYVDFLRVLLGWIGEVDDFHRQVMCLNSSWGYAYFFVSGVLPFQQIFSCIVFCICAFLRVCFFAFLLFL